jgi:hypothetical protein
MAIKSQQAALRVSTATAAADVITAITAAAPPVVTSATHGIANGAIITIAGVSGMIEVNNRAYVVANQATNTVELKGVDGLLYTPYGSGGTMVAHTMTEVGSIRALSGFDGQASEIDTTHLRSTAKEFLIGLQDFGNVELGMFLVSDAGQTKLRSLKSTASIGTFSITLSDGTVAAFQALVRSCTFDTGGPDGAVTSSVSLRVTGEPAWFA